jgi:threonine dehydrogenase-like Zn-dependent dehydrogenase
MKRLLITAPKQVTFDDVEMPICATDGVVVRARVTAISTGTELRVFRAIPVDEAGADVSGVAVGDRVFVPAPHGQFAAVTATQVTPLPDAIPDDEAVMLNILEVGHTALRQGDPAAGANVAIVGQGVIGLSLTAYAEAFGFRTAVVDTVVERLAVARQMGVLLAVNLTETDSFDRIHELFDCAGADVAFEAASHWSGIRAAMQLTRTDGKVVVVSRHTNVPDFNPVGHPFLGKRLNLITTYGYPADGCRWSRNRSFGLTVDLLARGRLKIGPMLTHRFSWEELPEVYHRMDEGDRSIVGAIIDWAQAE